MAVKPSVLTLTVQIFKGDRRVLEEAHDVISKCIKTVHRGISFLFLIVSIEADLSVRPS